MPSRSDRTNCERDDPAQGTLARTGDACELLGSYAARNTSASGDPATRGQQAAQRANTAPELPADIAVGKPLARPAELGALRTRQTRVAEWATGGLQWPKLP
jgi:hypothetical protein